MILLDKTDLCCKTLQRPHFKVRLPKTRPSILDRNLETEPWIDQCPCADRLVLFLHNHPIAVIAGSSLECATLNMRLHQLRHRWPRRR